CFAVKLEQYQDFQSAYPLSDQKLFKYGVMNIIEETLQEEGADGFCCEIGASRFAVVVFWTKLRSRHQMDAQSLTLARRIIANVKQFLKLTVSIGISKARVSIAQLADAWQEADQLLDAAFYAGGGSAISSDPAKVKRHSLNEASIPLKS